MGGGHAVFFAEVVGFVAVEFEPHGKVVGEGPDFVPLLRFDGVGAGFGGEFGCGEDVVLFVEQEEFQTACEDAQFAPGAFLGVVAGEEGGGDGVGVPDGHLFVADEIGGHGGFPLGKRVGRWFEAV